MAAKFLNLHPSEVNPKLKLLADIKKFYLSDSDISLKTIKKSAGWLEFNY